MKAITIGSHVIFEDVIATVQDMNGAMAHIHTGYGESLWVSVSTLALRDDVQQPEAAHASCYWCHLPIYELICVVDLEANRHWHVECYPHPPSKRHLL